MRENRTQGSARGLSGNGQSYLDDKGMKIIGADPSDSDRIREIYLKAFDEAERESVADLAIALLSEESDPRPVHLVAAIDGNLIGHVSFSPVGQKDLQNRIGYILAPLAVAPEWQKRGVGSALVRKGLSRFKRPEDGIILVYGDPGYYQRFGFTAELAANFLPPYPLRYPFGWQGLRLDDCKIPDTPVSIECVAALCLPEIW